MNEAAIEKLLTAHVATLISKIVESNPIHAAGLYKAINSLNDDEIQLLEEHLQLCGGENISLDYLAKSYNTLVNDFLRESVYFQANKTYRYSNAAEVAKHVYCNDEYMSLYMHGVLLSQFFWQNHIQLFRFFRKTIPKQKKGQYLEIGPGHGYFIMTAAKQTSFDTFTGVDISTTSIRQTKALLERKAPKKNWQLQCIDFIKYPLESAKFDAIVMGEMLEHVENPQDYLEKIVSLAAKDAYIFITTCVNAPAIDHIYLFKKEDEIKQMFLECGLRVKKECILPYMNRTLEECVINFLPINVGYVLEVKND